METLSVKSILDFIYGILDAITPLFLGNGWRQILFQFYSIVCLSSYSIFRMIKVRGPSVIVLSRIRLIISILVVGTIYIVCHQILVAFNPVDPNLSKKIIFFVISFFVIALLPYHSANLFTQFINRVGQGPYIVEIGVEHKEEENEYDFWMAGSNFVRRVNAMYYINGLYMPFIIVSLIPRDAQLVLLFLWFVSFVVLTLLRIHILGGPIIFGYFMLMIFGSKYFP